MGDEPVRCEIHIAATPEQIFSYFCDPELIVRWMGEWADLDPVPGGRFAVNVRGTPARGEFVEVDPPRRIVWTWGTAGSDDLPPGASTVAVELTAFEGGTLVALTHSDLPTTAQRDSHRRGWTTLLDLLPAQLT